MANTSEKQTRVGVGVTVYKDGKVLLGKRRGSHGEGEYASPGGHLEFGESFEGCARRETMEETSVQIKNIRFQFLLNMTDYKGKHYVHIALEADWEAGDPVVNEPEKVESWGWYDLNNLPQPLFKTHKYFLQNLKTGQKYFDSKIDRSNDSIS